MNITRVGFPGLGIEDFDLNKIAFSLFGTLEVRWYGIFITLGIVFAFLYANNYLGLCIVLLLTMGFSVCMIALSKKIKILKWIM
jgi:prolipoprotein diacylglyceryltransferase